MTESVFQFNQETMALDKAVRQSIAPRLAKIDAVRDENQWRMLHAFTQNKVGANHLAGSTGYGYGDAGREKLEAVFAGLTGSVAALFRHQFMSGTHTLAALRSSREWIGRVLMR